MKDIYMAIAIFGLPSAGILILVKILTDYVLKKKLIEKGAVKEEAQILFAREQIPQSLGALKWALVLGLAGLGLVIIEFTPYDYTSPLPAGIIVTSIAIGFLVYYFVAKREMQKTRERPTGQ